MSKLLCRILVALVVVVALPARPAAAQDAAALVGAWRAEVRDPVQGTATVELLLGNDGRYQRTYRPQAYFGMVHDSGIWAYDAGLLQLRWSEFTVIPQPMYPPLQQGTDTFVVVPSGRDAFRFRSPGCTAPACWSVMLRVM